MFPHHRLMSPEDDGGTTTALPAAPAASPPAGPVGSGGTGEKPAEVKPGEADSKPTWPEDWRTQLAGGDEKAAKQLSRYASPQEVWKKARELEVKVSSGALRPLLGKDASAEEVSEYRKAWGIPEKPEGYDIGVTDKMQPETKALLDKALPVAHSLNLTPDQTKGVMKFLNENAVGVKAQQIERDEKAREDGTELLRNEWGPEYKRNINLIHNVLDSSAAPGFKEVVLEARGPDGIPLASNPEWLRMLLRVGLKDNPAGLVVPNSGADPAKSVAEEMKVIEDKMGTKAYTNDEKMQARYRELVEIRDQLAKRAA